MLTEDKKTRFRVYEEKRRILLVEDDIVNREMLKESLGGTYNIVIAETGEDALSILRTQYETISIVLLDLNLPGIKGVEVLKRIKANPAYSHLPVIVMTSEGEAEVECLTLGAIDFIPKPYPPSKVILARILRTVELSEDRDILRVTERDNLTGLYNKEFFYRYAQQFDLYHKDTKTDAIVLDINRFSTINERFGKACGDEILKRVAEKALDYVNEAGGIVCRSDADTFMFYCPHRDEYEAMFKEMSDYTGGTPGDHRIRLRMGVYSDVDKTLDIERRFDRAKMAADKVRGNLSKPIGFYNSEIHETEVLAEQLIDDFSSAIREKQFAVFYQPKYNIRGEKPHLVSAEALVRWNHSKLGMISPGVFIPLFEKNGLIQELDRYVWSETAAQIRKWKEEYNVTLPVSVNVSRIDLYDPELTEKLQKIIDGNGLCAGDLMLEITESAYTENAEQIIERVKNLRNMGFKIEMDDFGSGYSSLSMLSYLPIDALKLDMHFIWSAFGERKDTRLLEAMIGLAALFKLPTIAEGVETEEQVTALKKMGCDIVQGYYFSRPVPAGEFEKFIKKAQ